MTEVSNSAVRSVDIGGTKVALAMVEGTRVTERRQFPTPRTDRGSDLVAAIASALGAMPGDGPVAIATTGLVDEGRLTALNPDTLPIENGFPLVDALRQVIGSPPLLVNDAQAAAWGEYRHGAGRGCASFAFMTVSTGIGAGIVVDGRLIVGRRGLAGHLGHVVAEPEGTRCGCGRRGCLETVASGTALARLATAAFGRAVAAPDLFALAAEGDTMAEGMIRSAARSIAIALGNLAASCDVERIALGGGVGLAPGFLERVVEAAAELPPTFHREIVRAEAGPDAGLIGVAALLAER
ncbi:N-acetylmannosamine kinase [Mangrovicella endophytica]|uniref:N-acetylmannosamine kinase n=1 Tax=Mangrovicella endophytica TaxID=2066697 RepID=UPI000C9E36AE|nr:N-acetylmannosamine kinase [Mangrovicella endophytica]